MAAEVKDIAAYIAPLWVIDKRIQFHATPGQGRILDGIIYDREGILDIKGRKDLPLVQSVTFADQEGWAPGAAGANIVKARVRGLHSGVSTAIQYMVLIASRREYGLFERDPTVTPTGDDTNYVGRGVLDWVTRVRDAVERLDDGTDQTDALLEGTVSKPVLTNVRDVPVSDLAWMAILEFQIDIESICRGARSIPAA